SPTVRESGTPKSVHDQASTPWPSGHAGSNVPSSIEGERYGWRKQRQLGPRIAGGGGDGEVSNVSAEASRAVCRPGRAVRPLYGALHAIACDPARRRGWSDGRDASPRRRVRARRPDE